MNSVVGRVRDAFDTPDDSYPSDEKAAKLINP